MGGLLGFRMEVILARFRDVETSLCVSEKLNMSVRALIVVRLSALGVNSR